MFDGSAMSAVEVMRAYLDAMQRGDHETAFAYYADDIVARIPGRSRFAGVARGREQVVSFLQAMLAGVEEVEIDLVDLLSGNEHVALLLRERLRGARGTLDIGRMNLYRVSAGKITEIAIFEADQYEVDEYLAE